MGHKSKTLGTISCLALTAAIFGASLSVQRADAQQAGAPAGALVLQGGTLIDGNGGPAIANAVVVIQGNRITAAGRAGAVQIPAGARIIDAKGKYIIPGLIDAKSNYYWYYGEANLVWGVTSAMISGARNDVGIAERDAIMHGTFTGPRIYQTVVSLEGAGPKGDYPDTFKPGDGGRVVATADLARKLVDADVAAGADFVTIENGDGAPDVFAAGIDEAHKLGKKVAFRAVGPQVRAQEAAEMGADVLIHMGQVGNEVAKDLAKWKNAPPFGGADPFGDMDPAKVPAMIKLFIDHHTVLEPELISDSGTFSKHPERYREETHAALDDPTLRAYFPDYRISAMLRKFDQQPRADQVAAGQEAFHNKMIFLHQFLEAGGHLAAGTDCPQSAPGIGVEQEMALFQEDAGATPMQALQSATKWVADAFGVKDIGSIEPGKLADIDIVDADPLADINNVKKMDVVIQDGKVVDRHYHAWYKSPFGASSDNAGNPVVPKVAWATALKAATNTGRGFGQGAMDPVQSPTPGVESLFPYELPQGSSDTVVTLKGFNFTNRSVVYVDGTPVPTKVVGRNELQATVSANILARAGRFQLVVKNPAPLATPEWGDTSNDADLLVPFAFTTAYSKNTL